MLKFTSHVAIFKKLVLLLLLGFLTVSTASAEQLRYHLDKSVYIDIDMTHGLQGKVQKLKDVARKGDSPKEVGKIQTEIINEIYKGSINASLSPNGLKFGVRKGQIRVIQDGKGTFKNQPNPFFQKASQTVFDLPTAQGDVLTGGSAETLQVFETRDSEIGNTVGSVALDLGELESVENVLLFGSVGTPMGGIVIKSSQGLLNSTGFQVQLISDFLEQHGDQILSSPHSLRRVESKPTPAVYHPSP